MLSLGTLGEKKKRQKGEKKKNQKKKTLRSPAVQDFLGLMLNNWENTEISSGNRAGSFEAGLCEQVTSFYCMKKGRCHRG